MQPKFLIDVSRLVKRALRGREPTGVDRVCLAHVERRGVEAQAVLRWGRWRHIVPYAVSQELFTLLLRPWRHFARQGWSVVARAHLPDWHARDPSGQVYLNLGHSGLESAGLTRWLQRKGCRSVFMVHDLIPITHPEYCRRGERRRHVARMENILRSGSGLLTNSEATAASLRRFARSRGLRLPPLQAAPLAPAVLPHADGDAAPLRLPYFVVLGTIEPRKNHSLLLHVWRELVQKLGPWAPHLVVIGQSGWESENVIDLLERCEPLRSHVHELPTCSDAALGRYLAHARALLFPSFAEGYGMPLVEALMLGTPVIASPLGVFSEIAGNVPEYIDPLDGPGWAEAVRDYAHSNSPRRAAQMARMRSFVTPTWDDHFAQVERLLERLE